MRDLCLRCQHSLDYCRYSRSLRLSSDVTRQRIKIRQRSNHPEFAEHRGYHASLKRFSFRLDADSPWKGGFFPPETQRAFGWWGIRGRLLRGLWGMGRGLEFVIRWSLVRIYIMR
jgi:hypothetical protein